MLLKNKNMKKTLDDSYIVFALKGNLVILLCFKM
jgi:hypothetical protein